MNNTFKQILFLLITAAFLSACGGGGGGGGTAPELPAPGTLDATFKNYSSPQPGIIKTDINGGDNYSYAVAVQGDGKIVVAGAAFNGSDYDFAVVRYNSNGSLDTTFNGTGIVTTNIGTNTDDTAFAVAIDTAGNVVVAGETCDSTECDFAVVRYTANGTPDSGFGTDGIKTADINFGRDDIAFAIAIQGDKIVVAGETDNGSNTDFAIIRYNSDGTTDFTQITDFGDFDGAYAVTLQGDNILVAGYSNSDFAIARYTSSGTLDTGFGTDGLVTTDILGGGYDSSTAITTDKYGNIVVAGWTYNGTTDIALVKYDANGAPDPTFGPDSNGIVITDINGNSDYANAVAVQADGKIVVAGETWTDTPTSDFAVIRYLNNGLPDNSFGSNGIVTTDINGSSYYETAWGVAIQNDGKIIATGESSDGADIDFAVIRYWP